APRHGGDAGETGTSAIRRATLRVAHQRVRHGVGQLPATRLGNGSPARAIEHERAWRCPAHRHRRIMRLLLLASALFVAVPLGLGGAEPSDPYFEIKDRLYRRRGDGRVVPMIPPVGEKLRVIIDTDAHNEIDDVWALALALLSPERFDIVGFVAANYDNDNEGAGPRSIETSAATIREVMARCGVEGRYPVKLGSPPMRYRFEPSKSEGVDFIVERAMAATPEDPLWIIGLGAATNLASAYLQEPRIADRVIMFWHGRTEWPHKANNFNVHGDVRAAQILFQSDIPLVLFDTGGHLSCPMEESSAWAKHSELGRYLHD